MATTPPTLEQYPGYYPPGKGRFWTRTKVGVATALVGLVVGTSVAGGDAVAAKKPAPVAAAVASGEYTQADIDQAVAAATSSLQSAVNSAHAEQRAAVAKLKDREKARLAALRKGQRRALARVRAADRKRQSVAVAQARQAAASSNSVGAALSSGGTDPHFSYCYEAVAAGYGPYYQGTDPEYDWYTDADNDGVVCE